MSERDFDVIVIGAGGAGLAAARSAAEQGARVLVADAGDKVGGSTAMSGGVFYAAGTSVQAAAGVSDTPEAMYRYAMILNQYRMDAALVSRLAHASAPTLEWLISLGVKFPLSQLYAAGLDGVKRGHRAEGMGHEIVDVLNGALDATGHAEIALRTRVSQLHRLADGTVAGIRVDGETISAGAVILASGGFGANAEKLARLFPDVAVYGDWSWYVGSPHCRGDGLDLGLNAGGTLTGLNTGSAVLTPGFSRDLEPYIPGWFMFVGRDGRRFADETIDYAVSSALVRELPGGECFAIFDEDARASAKPNSSAKDQKKAYPFASWTADRLAEMADTGRIVRASSIHALADTAGIDADRLETTIATYNSDAAAGTDTAFFKAANLLRPIKTAPFYAVRIRPAIVGTTGAGLRIDTEARVLDRADRPLPGLYAAGEVVGGIHGPRYMGGGASIANAVTFGRIAGLHATRSTRRN